MEEGESRGRTSLGPFLPVHNPGKAGETGVRGAASRSNLVPPHSPRCRSSWPIAPIRSPHAPIAAGFAQERRLVRLGE